MLFQIQIFIPINSTEFDAGKNKHYSLTSNKKKMKSKLLQGRAIYSAEPKQSFP